MSTGKTFEILLGDEVSRSRRQPCAVKRVRPGDVRSAELGARLLAESVMLRELGGRHGVLGCYEIRCEPPELVLELAPGGSLAELLAPGGDEQIERSLDRAQVIGFFRDVANAVAHAHARGIIHRDIKPSNILFTATNEIRLSDFGIAVRRGARSTADGWEDVDAGTLGWAAPELLRDPASANTETVDIYGLGALLHEMLLGVPPHMMQRAESEIELRARIVAGAPRDLTPRESSLSPRLRALLDVALAPNPSLRPQSVAELLALLDHALRNAP